MPRSIFDKPAHSRLYILLNGATADMSRDELGAIIGRTAATARARMKRPEDLTVAELTNICRSRRVPIEELRQAIVY